MIRRFVGAAALALTLVAAGCGGGGGNEGSGNVASIDGTQGDSKTKTTEKPDYQKAALAYAKCMRANGVDTPDPDPSGMVRMTPGATQPDEETMKKAEAACKAERQALEGSMGEPDKDFQDKALKMSRCLREKGVDMPDPTMGEGGKASVEIDPELINSPEFKKAEEACRKQVGMREPGAPVGSGG